MSSLPALAPPASALIVLKKSNVSSEDSLGLGPTDEGRPPEPTGSKWFFSPEKLLESPSRTNGLEDGKGTLAIINHGGPISVSLGSPNSLNHGTTSIVTLVSPNFVNHGSATIINHGSPITPNHGSVTFLNHASPSQSHRSRKEKLICRSIVTSESVSPETETDYQNANSLLRRDPVDPGADPEGKSVLSNNIKLNCVNPNSWTHPTQSPIARKGPRAAGPAPAPTKPKTPRKNPKKPRLQLPITVFPGPSNNHMPPALPNNHQLLSLMLPDVRVTNSDSTTNSNSTTNGLVFLPSQRKGPERKVPAKTPKSPRVKKEKVQKVVKEKKERAPKKEKAPPKEKKERVSKVPKERVSKEKKEKVPRAPRAKKERVVKPKKDPTAPKPPRKPRLTKQQKLLQEYYASLNIYSEPLGPSSPPLASCLGEGNIALTQPFLSLAPPPGPPPACPGPKKGSQKRKKKPQCAFKYPVKRRYKRARGHRLHDNIQHDVVADDEEEAEVELRQMPPPNNTHLLLSPTTLKRMLKTPSPSLHGALDEDPDEELMLTSNSLFRDLRNRQFRTPSPTGGSQYGGSLRSSGTGDGSTSVSPTSGRSRYSRRKFSRLHPPFEKVHCAHELFECTEAPLGDSIFCGSHTPPEAAEFHSQCSYTCPSSLKRCPQYTVGTEEREFHFCDNHAARIAMTRQRMHRNAPEEVKTIKTMLKDLKDSMEPTELVALPPPEPKKFIQDANGEFKEDLSLEFNIELAVPPPERGKNLRQMSDFQVDFESDEDLAEADDSNLLEHAGYYSTDEVISIYRSKMEKLQTLYKSQFGVLKNTYMEYRRQYLCDTQKTRSRRSSFTSNPNLLNVSCPKVSPDFKAQQADEKAASSHLNRYHHRKSRMAVIQRQARLEYQDLKAKEKLVKVEVTETESEGEDVEVVGVSEEEDVEETPYDYLLKMQLKEAAEKTKPNSQTSASSSSAPSTSTSAAGTSAEGAGTMAQASAPFDKICTFTSADTHSTKCTKLVLPPSKFCQEHILNDPNQTLFSLCNRFDISGKERCKVPIIKGMHPTGCPLHRMTILKPFRNRETERKQLEEIATFPSATGEEEEQFLENLLACEVYNMSAFDSALKYVVEKGFEAPDTEDSEEENESEEEEDEKILSNRGLQTPIPTPTLVAQPSKARKTAPRLPSLQQTAGPSAQSH